MGKHGKKKQKARKSAFTQLGAVVLVLLLFGLAFVVYKNDSAISDMSLDTYVPTLNPDDSEPPVPDSTQPAPDISPETTADTPPAELHNDIPDFEPYAVDSTQPDKFIQRTDVTVNGVESAFTGLTDRIDFGLGSDYTDLKGVITFRGNNFRDSPSYGTADIKSETLSSVWNEWTGSLTAPDGASWTGSGWTGQPLIVEWPKETRQVMNMHDWAKDQEKLVEVIYATMDGTIYFYELETGKRTRDDKVMGYTFKGAGALDPRGYPILYVGAGYNSSQGTARVFVISLIDFSILYEFGNNDPFSLRGALSFFDSSPLVDPATDQLIYPGENGILYIVKLNTQYDESEGTLSVSPSDIVRWRYMSKKNAETGNYWLGMEDSAIIYRGHIIMADNGGMLMCLDLNTLELVWVQDLLDDTNATPVLELEDGHPYIYIGPAFHLGWRSSDTASVPLSKIDAVTGEFVWQHERICHSVSDLSGGLQGSPALGKNDLEDLVFFTVARTPTVGTGTLVALDKKTGELVWERQTQVYSWSSPICVYTPQGKGYIIYCTSSGHMYLLEGLTGELMDNISLNGSNIEASPAAYNNYVVVGTRTEGTWGIKMN